MAARDRGVANQYQHKTLYVRCNPESQVKGRELHCFPRCLRDIDDSLVSEPAVMEGPFAVMNRLAPQIGDLKFLHTPLRPLS